MIEGARFPGNFGVTTGTFLRKIRGSMRRIGRSIVILQVAAHTSGRRTNKTIRMAADAINTYVATR